MISLHSALIGSETKSTKHKSYNSLDGNKLNEAPLFLFVLCYIRGRKLTSEPLPVCESTLDNKSVHRLPFRELEDPVDPQVKKFPANNILNT